MISHNIRYLGTFLPHRMKREVKELYTSTILMNLGLAMVQMFEPIYLFSLGYSLQKIVWYYFVVYLVYLVILPLGAKFACRYGTERSIEVSTFFVIFLYLSLFAIQYYPELFYVSALFYALQKMFYWPAFHVDFAQNIVAKERGREVSSLTVAISLVSIVGPMLAGLLIWTGGFGWLFIIVSVIFLLSNLPLMVTTEKVKPIAFSYWQAIKNLFSSDSWRLKISFLGYAEEFIAMVIWPIFIALIIKDDFKIGLVIGLMVLVSTSVTLITGRLIDHGERRPMLRLGSAIHSLVWIMCTLITSVSGVFWVGSMSVLSKNVISVALTDAAYSRARGSRAMTAILEFEYSLVIAKLLVMVLIFILLSTGLSLLAVFNWSFVAAAVASLLYMML